MSKVKKIARVYPKSKLGYFFISAAIGGVNMASSFRSNDVGISEMLSEISKSENSTSRFSKGVGVG